MHHISTATTATSPDLDPNADLDSCGNKMTPRPPTALDPKTTMAKWDQQDIDKEVKKRKWISEALDKAEEAGHRVIKFKIRQSSLFADENELKSIIRELLIQRGWNEPKSIFRGEDGSYKNSHGGRIWFTWWHAGF